MASAGGTPRGDRPIPFRTSSNATPGAAPPARTSRVMLIRLLLGLVFGSLGVGYWIYGRRRQEVVPLICGTVLIVVPIFVSTLWLLALIDTLFVLAPWLQRYI